MYGLEGGSKLSLAVRKGTMSLASWVQNYSCPLPSVAWPGTDPLLKKKHALCSHD